MDAETPMEIAAAAISDRHNDLSHCAYYRTVNDPSVPTEMCSFGCYDEPQCQTCNPGEWPAEELRRKYPHLLDSEPSLGEPDEDERIDAVAVLVALHEAGWRLTRTEVVKPTWVERDWRAVDEWTPEAKP